MNLYRKRPITVEAVQWTGDNEAELQEFTGNMFYRLDSEDATEDPDHTGTVYTRANSVWIPLPTLDWVIKDSAGFYPCKDNIFKATYEPLVER